MRTTQTFVNLSLIALLCCSFHAAEAQTKKSSPSPKTGSPTDSTQEAASEVTSDVLEEPRVQSKTKKGGKAVTSPAPRATPQPQPQREEVITDTTEEVVAPPAPRDDKPVVLGRTQEEIENEQESESPNEQTFGVAYNLSPLGFPVLLKHGPSIWWPADQTWQLELSYLTGGLSLDQLGAEIGSAKESLVTLNARRYSSGRLFNWIVGLSYQSYDATLGRDLLSTISGIQSTVDVVKTRTVGLQLGMGNRWEWENFVIGADWFILNIPFMKTQTDAPALQYLNDENAKRRIEDAVRIMQSLPSIVLTRFTLGYEF